MNTWNLPPGCTPEDIDRRAWIDDGDEQSLEARQQAALEDKYDAEREEQ